MTAIEQQQIKGVTVKNVVVTIISTASIVASVITTYFGLKTDIQTIKSAQEAESKISDIRLKILEEHVDLLQKEVNDIQLSGKINRATSERLKTPDPAMLSAVEKR